MINCKQIRDKMSVSYFDENGNIAISDITIDDREKYVWTKTTEDDKFRDKTYVSQDGFPVKKERKSYLDKYRKIEFLLSLPERLQAKIFSNNQPRKFFWDIETEVFDDFPDAGNPVGRIFTHQYCDEFGNGTVMGIKPLSQTQIESIEQKINDYLSQITDKTLHQRYKFRYIYYPDEFTMNKDFVENHATKMPCIFGWNVLKFDTRYLVNRCKKTNIDPTILSPKRMLYSTIAKDKFDHSSKIEIELPLHRPIIDYMQIFEFFDRSIKQKSSMSLDFIASEILGVKKIHHSETLMELYEKDYERYVLYGIIDTFLVALIDKKCRTFESMSVLANLLRVEVAQSMFVSVGIETLLCDYYYKHYNKVFVKDYDKQIPEGETYSAGFVLQPGIGVYDGIVIYDYESLFPSIMQMLNVGEDVYLGHTDDQGKTYVDKLGEEHELDETMCYSSSGAVYSKNSDSAIRTMISNMFNKRVEAKHKEAEIKADINHLKQILKDNFGH